MGKIKLGIDVGTNSIGWAVLEKQDSKYDFIVKKDENGKLIPSKGSYIFPKGTIGNENSKAAERRGFRGARRRIDRIRLRKIATLKVLAEYGLCPQFAEGELNRWKNKKIYPCENKAFIEWQRTGKKNGNSKTEKLKQPYYLRYLAATSEGMMDTPQCKLQLGRAFYHISQRRGYLSNSDEEQTEDKLDLFKNDINNLLIESSDNYVFTEPFNVILDLYKGDKKVKTLGNKINKQLKIESSFEKIKTFIKTEFDKPDNLGKVAKGIKDLTDAIGEHPTMGSYFYSIYAESNKKTGLINKIRGRYTHREEHYEKEFNYICEKQKIPKDLREKLHNAIFYQRPLKSQKGLVAKCPLDTKRKRIAISHPLFEEFRMWESINRIKIGLGENPKLDFLTKDDKKLIKPLFLQKTDFEFRKIANKLCGDKMYCYIRKPQEVYFKGEIIEGGVAEVSFNFPLDKSFSACPTISTLKKILGEQEYNSMPYLNSGYKEEKGKKEISIEDVWHCLFTDTFGNKSKKEARKEFAEKHLQLDEKRIELFQKVKLKKGYGNLSKSAIKKILPFLEKGELYSHAVFLANISGVLGRKISDDEKEKIAINIKNALQKHKSDKKIQGIVNNYISSFKENKESLGDNNNSIEVHQNGINKEIENWIGKSEYEQLNEEEQNSIKTKCWNKFKEEAKDKHFKDIKYLSIETVPEYIQSELEEAFPDDKENISENINKLYHPSAMEAYKKADKELGNPEISAIKNPVFNRAMHQIKRLTNELIKQGLVDKDTEVNVEVAGEINSASYRRALTMWQKDQEMIRKWAKEKIINTYPKECRAEINPSDTDIVKYILWNEQNRKCIYTLDEIGICDFLGEKITCDIEHTIPRSKLNDNSLRNKTLANADFNRNYKKDKLPALLEENFNGKTINAKTILQNRDNYLKSYSFSGKKPNVNIQWNETLKMLKDEYKKYKNAAKVITDASAHDDIMTRVHYTNFKLEYLRDKYKQFETEEITSKFTNANLVDTRIIAKYARAYLNSYFNKVNVVNGKITDTLRKIWGLQRENETKDRSNHIHHCIDAITVACTEKGTANRISEAYHNYERDYFKGNNAAKIRLSEPMKDFVKTMNNLQNEVFIFHRQKDRIKPLLENFKKENSKKLNLRGTLNAPNPYGHIMKDGKEMFVQRKPISAITGSDIENIIDEGIKKRLLSLADSKGWEKITYKPKENENNEIKEKEHKQTIAFSIYSKLIKAKANKSLMKQDIITDNMNSNFVDKQSLVKTFFPTIIKPELLMEKQEVFKTKLTKAVDDLVRTKGLELLLSGEEKTSEGKNIVLPEYINPDTNKKAGQMVIKRLRLKAYNQNQYPLKEYREIDKSKYEYKHDFYFDKEKGSNYEARIYGDLFPDDNGKLKNRKYLLINSYNIVKNIYEKEPSILLLYAIHRGDMFLVFDKHTDEIDWKDDNNLQNRLFSVVKFDEKGIIVLERHNYADGNVDNVPREKCIESGAEGTQLSDLSRVVLRRSPSTLRAIPTKVDVLGNIDIEYSKEFITKHS